MLIPEKWVGLLGLISIYIGIMLFIKGEDEDESAILSSLNSERYNKVFLSVAFITFANGGDNIGIIRSHLFYFDHEPIGCNGYHFPYYGSKLVFYWIPIGSF